LGLIELFVESSQHNTSYFLYLLAPFVASYYFGMKAGYLLSVLSWLVFYLKITYLNHNNLLFPLRLGDQFITNYSIIYAVALIFVLSTAYAMTKERENRRRAEQLLAALENSHQRVAELAVTEERNRLARDIHDTLGHYLTVISIQLGKAVAFREKNPLESVQAIQDARRLAMEALQDVRQSVKSLREGEELFALMPALKKLVANLITSQFSIQLKVRGSEEGYSKQNLMVLYRAIQEGRDDQYPASCQGYVGYN
jgi:signal transduction histidine kinase